MLSVAAMILDPGLPGDAAVETSHRGQGVHKTKIFAPTARRFSLTLGSISLALDLVDADDALRTSCRTRV